jgi:hypothetical protein
MTPRFRLLAYSGTTVALLSAIAGLTCNGHRWWCGNDWLDVRASFHDLHEAQRLGEEKDAVLAALYEVHVARQAVLADLVARRLTLREAAARFRDLAQDTPDYPWYLLRASFPGPTDDERFCHQVIRHVQSYVSVVRPDEEAEVVARLEAELEACREPDGTIRLPPGRP